MNILGSPHNIKQQLKRIAKKIVLIIVLFFVFGFAITKYQEWENTRIQKKVNLIDTKMRLTLARVEKPEKNTYTIVYATTIPKQKYLTDRDINFYICVDSMKEMDSSDWIQWTDAFEKHIRTSVPEASINKRIVYSTTYTDSEPVGWINSAQNVNKLKENIFDKKNNIIICFASDFDVEYITNAEKI